MYVFFLVVIVVLSLMREGGREGGREVCVGVWVWVGMGVCGCVPNHLYVVVITPFGVLLLIYKADALRARKRLRVRPCKPQQQDKRCDN